MILEQVVFNFAANITRILSFLECLKVIFSLTDTVQKMKFSIIDFSSKCD